MGFSIGGLKTSREFLAILSKARIDKIVVPVDVAATTQASDVEVGAELLGAGFVDFDELGLDLDLFGRLIELCDQVNHILIDGGIGVSE